MCLPIIHYCVVKFNDVVKPPDNLLGQHDARFCVDLLKLRYARRRLRPKGFLQATDKGSIGRIGV